MDHNESRLISILFFTATSIFISGCFFREFLIHIWTSTMQVYAVGHGPYLAITLLVYSFMFGSFGAVAGLIVHHYSAAIKSSIAVFFSMIRNSIQWCMQAVCKVTAKARG